MTDDTLQSAILDYMATLPVSYTIREIVDASGQPEDAVTSALHRLDDDGRVLMRNGWYRLSEAERARRAAD